MNQEKGVYQLKNGYWAYRFVIVLNGKTINRKKTKDEQGKPFKSAKAASRAREAAINMEREKARHKERPRKTMAEVYQEYCEKGRCGKAYTTIRNRTAFGIIIFRKNLVSSISMRLARRQSWIIFPVCTTPKAEPTDM